MIKKGLVRTKIYEFIDEKESQGFIIDADYVFKVLPELWSFLKGQPDDLLGNAMFDDFIYGAHIGHDIAIHRKNQEAMFQHLYQEMGGQ